MSYAGFSGDDSWQYSRKRKYCYDEAWEQLEVFKGWLQKSTRGPEFARCKYCYEDIFIASDGADCLMRHMQNRPQHSFVFTLADGSEDAEVKSSDSAYDPLAIFEKEKWEPQAVNHIIVLSTEQPLGLQLMHIATVFLNQLAERCRTN